jgi:hypothetical protein
LGLTELDRRTVPEKPLEPVTVIVDEPKFPAAIVRIVGEATIVKSPEA